MEQEYKISINITPKAFEGLARQGMLCHQGICELCDDALAAALPGEKPAFVWHWRRMPTKTFCSLP